METREARITSNCGCQGAYNVGIYDRNMFTRTPQRAGGWSNRVDAARDARKHFPLGRTDEPSEYC